MSRCKKWWPYQCTYRCIWFPLSYLILLPFKMWWRTSWWKLTAVRRCGPLLDDVYLLVTYVPLQGRSTSCPVLDAFFSCMRECKDTQESPEFDYVCVCVCVCVCVYVCVYVCVWLLQAMLIFVCPSFCLVWCAMDKKAIQCTLIIFSCTQVRYILLAAPYRQEFIFFAYSVPCTSPQCLVWFQLWSSMAKQVLKSNVSGFISKFLTVISISLLACQCLDVKVQVPCHLHLTQTGSLGVCDPWMHYRPFSRYHTAQTLLYV